MKLYNKVEITTPNKTVTCYMIMGNNAFLGADGMEWGYVSINIDEDLSFIGSDGMAYGNEDIEELIIYAAIDGGSVEEDWSDVHFGLSFKLID